MGNAATHIGAAGETRRIILETGTAATHIWASGETRSLVHEDWYSGD